VGPHDDHFWHLFVQLKVDYLGLHRARNLALPLTLTLPLPHPSP
jgi:hypothetical protein